MSRPAIVVLRMSAVPAVFPRGGAAGRDEGQKGDPLGCNPFGGTTWPAQGLFGSSLLESRVLRKARVVVLLGFWLAAV
eukprot:9487177-Pyramimonas_sp.AAC.1